MDVPTLSGAVRVEKVILLLRGDTVLKQSPVQNPSLFRHMLEFEEGR